MGSKAPSTRSRSTSCAKDAEGAVCTFRSWASAQIRYGSSVVPEPPPKGTASGWQGGMHLSPIHASHRKSPWSSCAGSAASETSMTLYG